MRKINAADLAHTLKRLLKQIKQHDGADAISSLYTRSAEKVLREYGEQNDT